ncbi:GTPase Era [Sorangium sp. So ce375]|uniref:GTPase Era n=1 Tax=Sorangium sp. So ce375 TaxID=3133306 RepID=UPI003F5BAC39
MKARPQSAPQGAKARPQAPKPAPASRGPRPAKNESRSSPRGAQSSEAPRAGDAAIPQGRPPRRENQAHADKRSRRAGEQGGAGRAAERGEERRGGAGRAAERGEERRGGAGRAPERGEEKRGGAGRAAERDKGATPAKQRSSAARSSGAARSRAGRGPRAGSAEGRSLPDQRAAARGGAQQQRRKSAEPRRTEEADAALPRRSGRVALVGRPNVGKSTLLNAALGHPLAIVSPTPQTTRDAILGVVHHGPAEIALLDTPGLHRPRTELGRVMNQAAREAARGADVIVFVTEAPDPARLPRRVKEGEDGPPLAPHPSDLTLLADLGSEAPVVFVLNKVDRMRDKALLLPLLDAFAKLREFAAIVPISALREDGVQRVLDEVAKLCPEGDWGFAPDELTDRPTRFFAAEYVREQILRATKAEVPHASAVQIERYVEPTGDGALHIDATIHVERPGQKKILIGAGAEQLKRIGTEARLRIEELVGRQVNLKLWVRVTPEWRESRERLDELGYNKGEIS